MDQAQRQSDPGEQRVRAADIATRRRRIVDSAQAYVLAHCDDAVRMADLCAHLDISARLLHYCFREVVNASPAQYLRALRLDRARLELLAGRGGGILVQDVAARWGFWHLSGFGADYKRMFGELPSQTLYGTPSCGRARSGATVKLCGGLPDAASAAAG